MKILAVNQGEAYKTVVKYVSMLEEYEALAYKFNEETKKWDMLKDLSYFTDDSVDCERTALAMLQQLEGETYDN
jgi:hypothetical protein